LRAASQQDHGVPATWSGLAEERIRIAPFEWRRRRWTSAPLTDALTRAQPLSSPDVARLLAVPEALQADRLKEYVQPVVAVRSSAGFNLNLASLYKTVWTEFGGARGQMCHAGPPHMFVPAGEQTAMIVRNAYLNLHPDEAAQIRTRAFRIQNPPKA